jgi:hypothetical protein
LPSERALGQSVSAIVSKELLRTKVDIRNKAGVDVK